jgi:hypothetical protein
MRYISPSEYRSILKRQGKQITLSYIYSLMREGKIPSEQIETTKTLKRIPWDDDKMQVVSSAVS